MDATTGPAQLPAPGETVDRYEVVAPLAQGGMATLYVVRRVGAGRFDKMLAMKVILPNLSTEREFVDMFLDEARIAAQVHHPNVVQVFDVGEHAGLPYMIMELLRGQSLGRIVKRVRHENATLPVQVALAILAQIADGLAAAHEATAPDGTPLRIAHRDVSPKNIHVDYDGHVKLLDFGIAAAVGKLASTKTGQIKGTCAYLAPEQIVTGNPVDHRADIWALGVVAWELLTGERLFAGDDDARTLWNVLHTPIAPVSAYSPHLPSQVAAMIMRCLSRHADQRPSSCRDVADVLWAGAGSHAALRDVGELVCARFAADRAIEDERIAAAVRRGPPPPIQEPEPASISMARGVPASSRPAARRLGAGVVAAAAVAAALAIALGAWALGGPLVRTSSDARPRDAAAVPVAAPAPVAAEPSAGRPQEGVVVAEPTPPAASADGAAPSSTIAPAVAAAPAAAAPAAPAHARRATRARRRGATAPRHATKSEFLGNPYR